MGRICGRGGFKAERKSEGVMDSAEEDDVISTERKE